MIRMVDKEHPVPELWRSKFEEIAAALAAGDFQICNSPVDGLEPVDLEAANHVIGNIAAYGDPLTLLDDATWNQPVYRWMGDCWQVLVDLSTIDEPVSDLTLHATVYEADCSRLKIESVHVP